MTYDEVYAWAEDAADEVRARRAAVTSHTSKGRTTRAQNGNSKLTEGQVQSIRLRRSEGATLVMIAAEHGISKTQVSRICRGEQWGWR